MKTEKVEKAKLTKEQMAWLKEFSAQKKASKLVKNKLAQTMAGAQKLKDMLGTMQQGMVRTLQMAPQNKTREIEGQDQ